MKTTRQQNRKAKVPLKRKADIGCTGAKKSMKRTLGRSFKPEAEGRCPEPRVEKKCVSQTLIPYAKIKLQLFPIDEGTRKGLEKEGHNPYLELTLSPRKKISSVLKRLNCKWGGSSIALGEPMLFPYNALKNSSSYRRWTLNDNDISAGYVYEAIGSPAIFRLRYGWFSYPEPQTFGKLSTSIPIQGFSQYEEDIQKGCSAKMDGPDVKGNRTEVGSESFKEMNLPEVAVDAHNDVNGPADPVDNEPNMDEGLGQSSALWTDSLTNISIGALLSEVSIQGKFNNSDLIIDGLTSISIGGLLSEASLQGKPNNCDPKTAGCDAGLQVPQPRSDSFDAYIAAQTNCSQGPMLSTQDPHSSILDAEETCHAFPFQRFSPSEKDDALPLVGSAYPGARGQDAGSESFNFSNAAEGNYEPVFPEGYACQESEIDMLFSSHTYHDESSLGLSGIKWTDSLGPFDVGLAHLSESYVWNGII